MMALPDHGNGYAAKHDQGEACLHQTATFSQQQTTIHKNTNLNRDEIITQKPSCNSSFEIALLRHPVTLAEPQTCYGRLDVALAPGWQAWADAQLIPLWQTAAKHIWSSPALRCALVANRLAEALGLPLTFDNRLMELDFGQWEGRSWAEIPRDALDRWAADPPGFHPPGGETGAALLKRVTGFTREIQEKSRSCIVISHGGPLRLLPALLHHEVPDLLAAGLPLGALEVIRLPACC